MFRYMTSVRLGSSGLLATSFSAASILSGLLIIVPLSLDDVPMNASIDSILAANFLAVCWTDSTDAFPAKLDMKVLVLRASFSRSEIRLNCSFMISAWVLRIGPNLSRAPLSSAKRWSSVSIERMPAWASARPCSELARFAWAELMRLWA